MNVIVKATNFALDERLRDEIEQRARQLGPLATIQIAIEWRAMGLLSMTPDHFVATVRLAFESGATADFEHIGIDLPRTVEQILATSSFQVQRQRWIDEGVETCRWCSHGTFAALGAGDRGELELVCLQCGHIERFVARPAELTEHPGVTIVHARAKEPYR